MILSTIHDKHMLHIHWYHVAFSLVPHKRNSINPHMILTLSPVILVATFLGCLHLRPRPRPEPASPTPTRTPSATKVMLVRCVD